MYNKSTGTKSNGQETLETLTTAVKRILDKTKVLDTFGHLEPIITKKLFGIPNTKITLIAGPMCAGKSAALIRKTKELHNSGLSYQCYRAKLSERTIGDNKDSAKEIKSREFEESIQAIPLEPDFDVETLINSIKDNGYKVIMFDEIHFLPPQKLEELIEGLKKLELQEIVFATLNMDFRGKEFPQFTLLSKIADKKILLTADCSIKDCNERATHSAKMRGNKKQQIEAGDEDMYRVFCYPHWRYANKLLDQDVTIDKKLEDKYSEEIKNLTDANSSFNKNGIIEFKDGMKICFNTKSHTCHFI